MRKYSPGHLTRRVRRELARMGVEADVIWRDAPSYRTSMSPRIIETRIRKDGETFIMHHAAGDRGNDNDVARIVFEVTEDIPGASEAEVEAVRARYRGALIEGEENWSLVTRRWTTRGKRLSTLVPVKLLDIAGRPHPMVIDWAGAGDFQAHSWAMRHLECDRARRDARGRPKKVRIGGGLAAVLRMRGDGLERAERLMDDLAAVIDRADMPNDMSAVTLVKVKGGDAELRWQISGRDIQIDDYRVAGARISVNSLILERTLPEQLLAAMQGRRLGDVVEGAPVNPETRIREARVRRRPWAGTTLSLDLKPIAPEDLVDELRQH